MRAVPAQAARRAIARWDPRPSRQYRRRLLADLAQWRAATRKWGRFPARLRAHRVAELRALEVPPRLAAAHAAMVAAAQAPINDADGVADPGSAIALRAELRRAADALEADAVDELERAHVDAVRAILRRAEDARQVAADRVRGARTQLEVALAALAPPRRLVDRHAAVRAALRDLARSTDRAIAAGAVDDVPALRAELENRRAAGAALAAAIRAAVGESGPGREPY